VTVIDVHTHMLNEAWLNLLQEHGGNYTLNQVPSGKRVVHYAGSPFMTLTPGMTDYPLRIAKMDEAGVDVAVVSLTCPNVFWGEPEISAAAARGTNQDMAAAQAEYPNRIRWLASLPWQFPDLAIQELERSCDEGAVGVMVLANIAGDSLTNPRFERVWAEIDRRALPVLVHPTAPPGIRSMEMERYHLAWSVGFTFDTTLALARMILDGFFDRYPNLKIIGGHAGGYLPFLLPRLDEGFRKIESTRESIEKLPSSYASKIYVDSIAYSVPTLEFTVAAFGPQNVLYGSDYPHNVGDMAGGLDRVDALPRGTAAAIRSENAARIFNL
jgi:aminocarboxymuconate-semialdehyde decarboxylase